MHLPGVFFCVRRPLTVMMPETRCGSTGFQCPLSLGTSRSQQTRGMDPPVAPVSGWTCTAAAKVSRVSGYLPTQPLKCGKRLETSRLVWESR